ncbi:MAG: AAA domain-containing protein [Eubacteriales bacterium]
MIDNNNLILVKGQDKTADIARLKDESGYIQITYIKGLQTYRYNRSNVIIFENPKEFKPTDYCVIKDGQILGSVVRIQQFKQHIRVFYKSGYHEIFKRESVALMPSCLREVVAGDRFAYFRELAHIDTLLGADGLPILGMRYDKISFIRDDSILSDYLRGQPFKNTIAASKTLYYPFGFNASQKQAVDHALNNRLSVIEGPPGTGKTQTILNIIANIVMRGQSVAVVSSNNSATENVEEKLKKYGVDFISAFLGNSANKEAFLLEQKKIPSIIAWKLDAEEMKNITASLPGLHKSLGEKLQKKNELSALKSELDSFQLEQQHFLTYYTETNSSDIDFKSSRHLKSRALLKLMAQCELRREHNIAPSFGQKLYNLLRFGIYNLKFYHNSPERIVAICQKRFYEARLSELKKQIASIEQDLATYNFDGKMREYSDLSMKLFRYKLAQKYEKQVRIEHSEDDLWKHSVEFIKDYPVILSTTHSLRSSLSNQYVYDYVIIDEASQVNVTTGALAFSCAKQAVVVGDLKQLSNVVDSEMKHRTDFIYTRHDLPEAYRYSNHSFLESIIELFPDIPRIILREHYRCSRKIINFCNQKYYDNQLIILTEDIGDRAPLAAYRTVPGNHARDHLNLRQIEMICREVIPQQKLDVHTPSVGIVTPYRNQADVLQKVFAGTQVKADTVDKFQGQERDVIILSTVDNDISDFADDDHRLNVAVSRAVKQLIVVISGNEPTRETGIGDLVHYIRYNNMDVINSEIYSVFDLLYKQYANVRRELLARQKRVSEYDSENLMYGVILEGLKEGSYSKYDVLVHVPLRMILRDLSKLESDRETQFVMNENTHVDFLIYDKISHQPVMIVEVDGSHHRHGSPQAERDHLKDQICIRYNIPLERFRTTGSNEKVRLALVLKRIIVG